MLLQPQLLADELKKQ